MRSVTLHPRAGAEFHIDTAALERSCWHHLTDTDIDLLSVAGAVAYADRSTRRLAGWRRNFAISAAVRNPQLWSRASGSLIATLEFVTGDEWNIDFVAGPVIEHQFALPLTDPPRQPVVTSFSGGLDSYLAAAAVSALGDTPVLVTSATNAQVKGDAAVAAATLSSRHQFGVPVTFTLGRHPEPSFRTRTFLFLAHATVAARLTGATRVVIGENGQGAVGASLVPFGHETPYRNTHPSFTALFAGLVREVLSREIVIEHPFLWSTKGATLRALHDRGIVGGWEATKSCSADVQRHKSADRRMACGICGNCILRQVAVGAAGLTDRTEYYWDRNDGLDSRPGTTRHYDRLAAHSVLSMEAFARMADDAPELLSGVDDLAVSLRMDRRDVGERVRTLRAAHATEWDAFVGALSSKSWIRPFLAVAS